MSSPTTNAVLVLAAAALMAGCHSPRGGLFPSPHGSKTWQSFETRPVTIVMVDVRSGEEFFSIDIPAGKELTIQFSDGSGDDPVYTPDRMSWDVWDLNTTTGRPRNMLSVPPAHARRIDTYYREGVEYVDATSPTYRSDEITNRPDYWSPVGGPAPANDRGVTNYDG